MNTEKFLRRLRGELPVWQQHGWVTGENSQAILQYTEKQKTRVPFFHALAILGATLLGVGLITYVAANWQGLGKLAKLLILLSAMYASYGAGAAAVLGGRSRQLTGGCFLAGLIAFGAAIMLVAQTYHIDSHNPSGALLLWGAGGLLSACLLRSEASLLLTVVLITLWSLMEAHDTPSRIHFGYLLAWLTMIPAVYRWRWLSAWHLALLGLMIWSVSVWVVVLDHDYSLPVPEYRGFYLIQLYFFVYCACCFAAMLLRFRARLAEFSLPVQEYALVGTLFILYLLSFPSFQAWESQSLQQLRTPAPLSYVYATLSAFVIWLGLGVWCWLRTDARQRWQGSGHLLYGFVLLAATAITLLANLFASGAQGSYFALAFNLLFFATTVWLVFVGMRIRDRFLVNCAFVFFALGLITRYFDSFWSLLDRSLFFVMGGLLLLAGAWFLEAQRRGISARIARQRQQETS